MKDRVFRYFDNQMDEAERIQFESDIASSSELQQQLKQMQTTAAGVRGLVAIPEMKDYFVSARVKALQSINKSSYSMRGWQYVTQTMIAAVFVVATYIGFAVSGSGNFQGSFRDIIPVTSEEYSDFMQSSSPEQSDVDAIIIDNSYSGELVNNVISKELNLDRKSSPLLTDDMSISTDDLLDNLSTNELEQLYASLEEAPIHKD